MPRIDIFVWLAYLNLSRSLLRRAVGDERAQTLAEYSLIISAIAVAVITIATITMRETIVGAYQSATNCLNGSC